MARQAGKKIQLNILTPRGVKFQREADFLAMRAIDGELGLLPGHAPMTAILGDGILRIVNDEAVEKMALFEGIVEIRDDVVDIYTTIAQKPEEIDLERARQEKEDAEAAIQEEQSDAVMQTLALQIRRALVRMEVGVHSTDEGYFEDREEDLMDMDEEDED